MALTNSPLVNLLTGQPINWNQAIGVPLVNAGGGSGTSSTGNAVYNALTGTQANPIKSTSASAVQQNNNWFYQIAVGVIGVVLIILLYRRENTICI